ncbi:hypothetical protein PAB09_03475 [Corynebacterium sp. SCR221107]|uniref:hypothetical protein n=1 Tax=Corynebacterium TaxID=1716 RepID=UPI0012DD4406|nr:MULTISPECIES: hypothetical protein [Corynebacterium]WBT09399.1 hypothetical protein PAB09_03475 [Corynebacterium sp. SCR221107]
MSKNQSSRTWLIAAVAALVVVAIVAVVVLTRSGDNSDNPQAQSPSTSAPATSGTSAASETNYPGAMVGNTQRTWPDPSGLIDDSAHATPGTWSVDFAFQRPVWTPINHDGDLPSKGDLVDGGFEQCSTGNVVLGGSTTQQYVNGRYLVVNSEAGPSRMNNGVPAGFAHSPQGAIALALNAAAYGVGGLGDGIGEEIDKAWWSTYETLQEDREFRGLNKPTYDHTKNRPRLLPAPGYYEVTQCNENVVVVEVGHDFRMTGDGGIKVAIPVYWRNGDWVPDLSGQAGVTFDRGGTFDPDNPAPLNEVHYQ